MPLPFAHSAAGLAGYLAFRNKDLNSAKNEELYLFGACLFLANLPDLDFLPGFIMGSIGKYHHGLSHSLAVSFSLAIFFYFCLIKYLKAISRIRILACCMVSALSHPIFDYFSKDTSLPYGVPLFWPFQANHYISAIPLFTDVQRNQDSIGNFFSSLLFNPNNIRGVAIESLFAGTIIFAITGLKNRSRPMACLTSFLISLGCGFVYYSVQIKGAL
jgi:inner membrane protein